MAYYHFCRTSFSTCTTQTIWTAVTCHVTKHARCQYWQPTAPFNIIKSSIPKSLNWKIFLILLIQNSKLKLANIEPKTYRRTVMNEKMTKQVITKLQKSVAKNMYSLGLCGGKTHKLLYLFPCPLLLPRRVAFRSPTFFFYIYFYFSNS